MFPRKDKEPEDLLERQAVLFEGDLWGSLLSQNSSNEDFQLMKKLNEEGKFLETILREEGLLPFSEKSIEKYKKQVERWGARFVFKLALYFAAFVAASAFGYAIFGWFIEKDLGLLGVAVLFSGGLSFVKLLDFSLKNVFFEAKVEWLRAILSREKKDFPAWAQEKMEKIDKKLKESQMEYESLSFVTFSSGRLENVYAVFSEIIFLSYAGRNFPILVNSNKEGDKRNKK